MTKFKRTPTYNAWINMKQRCQNANHAQAEDYGGRGIGVCERWADFASFLKDMGEKPPGRTLDRIDNDSGYSPDNCRWATRKEQNDNRRNNRLITYEGRTQTAKDWSKELSIPYTTILSRINHLGWDPVQSLKHD